MPHECLNCGKEYQDANEDILNGCVECGEARFQYKPPNQSQKTQSQPQLTETTTQETTQQDDENYDPRTVVAEVPDTKAKPLDDNEPDEKEIDEQVKEELNRQFTSIRIISEGKYQLDLVDLFENEDHVISLLGDGKYTIHLNEA